ncbi:MAG: MiaB/RimO family radical SAM methylthiotransferase [Thermoleophilia bacterium]|nr:MiaB/RimO family radical SAM methylthiotransferase [Thermoleophilia bacterium]
MARFSVRFLGCKVSQADAQLIRDALRDAGHHEVPEGDAEVRVVNTCALTVGAEKKSRKQVNRAARHARTFVTGCAANLNAGQFSGDVTVVAGSADKAAAEIVGQLGVPPEVACAADHEAPIGRTRAFLKVQNGCDYGCAFCIIPWTRGAAESRPLSVVIRDARRRIGEGHPELVLTGINIGTYRDPEGGGGLPHLIREVGRLEGLQRLRISSIEPGDLTEDLFAALAELQIAARHLHVPLQSGDDAVLQAMRRRYSVAQYLDGLRRARRWLPDLNLTSDAIVGFPTEDKAALEGTMAVAREAGMSKIHVFPYSPRPGTPAAEMQGRPAPDELKERAARVRDLSDQLGFAYRQGRLGKRERVLCEIRFHDGTTSGLGADYSRFVLSEGIGAPGRMTDVIVSGVAGQHLTARAVA